jgi:hypothetical protein
MLLRIWIFIKLAFFGIVGAGILAGLFDNTIGSEGICYFLYIIAIAIWFNYLFRYYGFFRR